MVTELFIEHGLIIIIAVLIVAVLRILKQPMIIGYIIAGILVSPALLNIIQSVEIISTLSEMGVALLLFMVGLNLNPKVIKEVGKVSLITGIGQVFFTSIIGYGIAIWLGFAPITSLYIAIALTFSSTIIITKLLSDKGDLHKLYGRISVGFLIVQDLIAILALMLISSISNRTSLLNFATTTFLLGTALVVGLFLFSYYALPKITKPIASSTEFLLLFSLGWCFAIAIIFDIFNFSIEIGALLAGVTLSLSPYRYEISSEIKPVRDFFIFLFFIWIGSQIVFSNIISNITAIIIFSLFILIGNPLIVIILMGILGYKKQTSFLAGLTVAQISEFSLILIALGVKVGHIAPETLSTVTLIGLITIGGSTYFIMYANRLYPYISDYLSIFERKKTISEKEKKPKKYDVILFGANRAGHNILEAFKNNKSSLLVVDHNPDIIENLKKQGFNYIYGDVTEIDLLDEIDLCSAKMIISTVNDTDANLLFLKKVKLCNPDAIILAVAEETEGAIELYNQGATYVITPHIIGGKYISDRIKTYKLNKKRFKEEQENHIKYLKKIQKK